MTERWTSPAGLGLAYRESGRSDGPPLLFLHGLSASSATYDEVRTSVDGTHRVFSLDFRGHGDSDRAPGTYQVPNYGADVAAFIEWVGQPSVLAGHSLGGALVCRVAEGSLSKVKAMVLIGTSPTKTIDLSDARIPITKVFAGNDGIATVEMINSTKHLLPTATRWVEIKGGNHSQFGHYGHQPFDGSPTISREEQQAAARAALLEALGR